MSTPPPGSGSGSGSNLELASSIPSRQSEPRTPSPVSAATAFAWPDERDEVLPGGINNGKEEVGVDPQIAANNPCLKNASVLIYGSKLTDDFRKGLETHVDRDKVIETTIQTVKDAYHASHPKQREMLEEVMRHTEGDCKIVISAFPLKYNTDAEVDTRTKKEMVGFYDHKTKTLSVCPFDFASRSFARDAMAAVFHEGVHRIDHEISRDPNQFASTLILERSLFVDKGEGAKSTDVKALTCLADLADDLEVIKGSYKLQYTSYCEVLAYSLENIYRAIGREGGLDSFEKNTVKRMAAYDIRDIQKAQHNLGAIKENFINNLGDTSVIKKYTKPYLDFLTSDKLIENVIQQKLANSMSKRSTGSEAAVAASVQPTSVGVVAHAEAVMETLRRSPSQHLSSQTQSSTRLTDLPAPHTAGSQPAQGGQLPPAQIGGKPGGIIHK